MTLACEICAVLWQIFMKRLLCAIHRAAYRGPWDRCGATFKHPALVQEGQAFTGSLPVCGILTHRCPVSKRGQTMRSGGQPRVPARGMQRSPWKSVCINLTLGWKTQPLHFQTGMLPLCVFEKHRCLGVFPLNNNRDCSQFWMVWVDFSSNKTMNHFITSEIAKK